jgi:hypothetical protein
MCLQQRLGYVSFQFRGPMIVEYLQPMPSQRKPGKQHPPFGASGHEEYPALVSQLMLPAHLCPCGQHPTDPTPGLSFTVIHELPVPQHTSGAPIEEQLFVPEGHANCLFASAALIRIRAKKSSSASGRKGDCASHVSFPYVLDSDLLSKSDANIQLSNMNISPSSTPIFFTPTGLSCFNLSVISSDLLACISSSGKYFKCFGTLCGHCSSAHDAVAHSNRRIVGGKDNRLELYMAMSGNAQGKQRTWIVSLQLLKPAAAEVVGGTRDSRIRAEIARLGCAGASPPLKLQGTSFREMRLTFRWDLHCRFAT